MRCKLMFQLLPFDSSCMPLDGAENAIEKSSVQCVERGVLHHRIIFITISSKVELNNNLGGI